VDIAVRQRVDAVRLASTVEIALVISCRHGLTWRTARLLLSWISSRKSL